MQMSFRNSKNSFNNMKNEAGTNLVVRVTPEEMNAIRRAAAECEMNVSQYIRAVIFKRKVKRAKPIALGALPDPADPMDEMNLFQR